MGDSSGRSRLALFLSRLAAHWHAWAKAQQSMANFDTEPD